MLMKDANWSKMLEDLPFPVEDYNMCPENGSTFLDIGSGFGKPNFHAAMQAGCKSIGVEVVPTRVAYAVDQKFEFAEHFARLADFKARNAILHGRSP